MRIKAILVAIVAAAWIPLTQAETVKIPKSVPFAVDSGASENVIRECEMQTRLPEYIKKQGKRRVDVELAEGTLEDEAGKILYLEFSNVFAPGGGGYSGSKSVIVAGELKENGELVASMTARRHSIIGMMPGTCSILKRIVKKLGEDIAIWLVDPVLDAKLGDLEDDADVSEAKQEG